MECIYLLFDQVKDFRDLASRNEILVIWTDCDREGENIGDEIVQVCRSTNRAIDVYRAKRVIHLSREIVSSL